MIRRKGTKLYWYRDWGRPGTERKMYPVSIANKVRIDKEDLNNEVTQAYRYGQEVEKDKHREAMGLARQDGLRELSKRLANYAVVYRASKEQTEMPINGAAYLVEFADYYGVGPGWEDDWDRVDRLHGFQVQNILSEIVPTRIREKGKEWYLYEIIGEV